MNNHDPAEMAPLLVVLRRISTTRYDSEATAGGSTSRPIRARVHTLVGVSSPGSSFETTDVSRTACHTVARCSMS